MKTAYAVFKPVSLHCHRLTGDSHENGHDARVPQGYISMKTARAVFIGNPSDFYQMLPETSRSHCVFYRFWLRFRYPLMHNGSVPAAHHPVVVKV
jgi:hypothetical protein